MSRRLYTYRDVEQLLLREAAAPWGKVFCFAGGVTVSAARDQRDACAARLRDLFAHRFDAARGIQLESLPDRPRWLPVSFEELDPDDPAPPAIIRPLWSDPHHALPPSVPPGPERERLIAFFSYKGGVGRTTCLLGLLNALLERRPAVPVLIVDADVEAPGLTWNLPRGDRISLLDVMALVHDSGDWRAEVLPLVRALLTRETVELPSGQAEFYFLPACRDIEQTFALPVRMEQLIRARGRSYIVAELLFALGEAVGAQAILVDMRAGVSEFSSPLVLDPRVQTVLVTSCNTQSVEGTVEALRHMRDRVRLDNLPEVLINMVPPDAGDELTTEVAARVFGSLPLRTEDEDPAAVVAGRSPLQIRFAQELIHYPSLASLMARLAAGSDLAVRTRQLAERLFPSVPEPRAAAPDRPGGLEAVAEVAKRLEYAERSTEPGLLSSAALTALVNGSPLCLPAAVVLGAKGSGKTYAWAQLVLARRWHGFVELLQLRTTAPDALIFPLLGPVNADHPLRQQSRQAEQAVHQAVQVQPGDGDPLSQDELRGLLAKAQEEPEAFWSRVIWRRLGLPWSPGMGIEALEARLRAAGVRVLLVVDGLEDALQTSAEAPLTDAQARLLRGLLQTVTNRLRDLSSPFLGLITFARRDLAADAIPQNFGQFEALYQRVSLAWSPTEALRLVAWLLDKAGMPVLEPAQIPRASYGVLRERLAGFWGRKMGSSQSREALTDRWVIAALSDLQGRLQARDMVRLIRVAAERAPKKSTALTPQSLKEAIPECSRKKLDELSMEILGLRPYFDRFREANARVRQIPFSAEDFDLSPGDISFLRRHGVILDQRELLYMPEIIRQGLGFEIRGEGRAKVLALYRRVTQQQDL